MPWCATDGWGTSGLELEVESTLLDSALSCPKIQGPESYRISLHFNFKAGYIPLQSNSTVKASYNNNVCFCFAVDVSVPEAFP